MSRSRRLSAAGLVVLALVGTPLLSGCQNPIQGIVEGAVEGATGGDVSLGGALPEGWPAEVPVLDGEIGFGGGANQDGQEGWVVTITSTSSDPIADARAQLEAAGFTEDIAGASAEGGILAMSNANYTVVIAGSPDGVIYTVGAKAG